MTKPTDRVAFAVTHSLDWAKKRYPWATAWIQVKGGIWCYERAEDDDAVRALDPPCEPATS